MALCEFCKEQCELWLKFKEEDVAFRTQMEIFAKLKALPQTIKETVEKKEEKALEEHIGFVDSVWTLAHERNCPNETEFFNT